MRYEALERLVMQKVNDLSQGMHPAANIAPLIDLVRQATLMGYNLTPMSPGERQAIGLAMNSAGAQYATGTDLRCPKCKGIGPCSECNPDPRAGLTVLPSLEK